MPGKYTRVENLLTLEEAIRKLSGLPASNLGLTDRGLLKENYFGDVVVFDPKTVGDTATFENPLQYANGIDYVWVNGSIVIKNGNHTNSFPGRFVKGPGTLKVR